MAQVMSGRAAQKRHDPYGVTTGWSALAKTIREVDEEKIRDCKEDIDTLLVFAGLFSAVTTAFIIETYKTLQQDPATVSMQLLKQIASQTSGNQQIDSGNRTVRSLSGSDSNSLSYEPPLNAIRVNVLWFASLILSLITASIGMLVKQWLREYLGGEYVGPRARLRIRHARYPGLARWKVFEIIAILPLLLQISLGLFFVGLCFFTSSVHPSIGNTSLPLVVSWSIFLFTTTVLPVFAPRCPYKSPFLKQYMKAIRPWWYSLVSHGKRYAHILVQYATRIITGTGEEPHQTDDLIGLLGLAPWSFDIPLDEEEDLVTTDVWDVDVMDAVDALLLDDDILDATIMGSLRESQFGGHITIKFLLALTARRLPGGEKDLQTHLPADLRPLTQRAWSAIMYTAMDTLRHRVKKEDKPLMWEPWIGTAILLLLSPYTSWDWKEIVADVSDILGICLTRNRAEVCRAIASAECFGKAILRTETVAGRLLSNFFVVLKPLEDEELAFACLEEIIGRRILQGDYEPGSFKLSRILDSPWNQFFTAGNLRDVAEVGVGMLERQMDRTGSQWLPWMPDAVSFIVDVMSAMDFYTVEGGAVSKAQSWLARGFCSLLARKDSSIALLVQFLQVSPTVFIGGNYLINALQGLYLEESAIVAVLDTFNSFVQTPAAAKISPIRLTHLAIRMIRLPQAFSRLEEWRQLFSNIAIAIERDSGKYPEDNLILAETCISLVHALECNNTDFSQWFFIPQSPSPTNPDDDSYFPLDDESSYRKWHDSLDPNKSLFPDDFILALSTIARKETRWYRVRRLKEMGYYVMSP